MNYVLVLSVIALFLIFFRRFGFSPFFDRWFQVETMSFNCFHDPFFIKFLLQRT